MRIDEMSTLKDLIDWLESQPADAVVPHGFGCPMSFRGNYSEVAFEPADTAKISDMLHYAKYAMGNTFEGYKGGEFTMDERTACWISTYGESWRADRIGPTLLRMWEWAIKTQALKMEPLADHAHELRRSAEKVGRPSGDVPAVMHQAAAYIEDLERRLREAEARVVELEAEQAERERQEPIATVGWDRNFMGVVWHGKDMPEKGVETLLYAAPPVTAPVRLTDRDKDGLAVPYSGMGGIEDYRAYAQDIETAALRANGFDIQAQEGK